MSDWPRLGVNIDHIATLRQLRGTPYPSLVEAASACRRGGASQITIHLREDRRHIQDADVIALKPHVKAQGMLLNLEMAISPAIVKMAVRVRPNWACLVPEKRREVTTEGGLDLKAAKSRIQKVIRTLQAKGIRVSLFIEPDVDVVFLARDLGADAVELHTGRYALLTQARRPSRSQVEAQLLRIRRAAEAARACDLHVHAGHGLDVRNVRALAALVDASGAELIEEYNIGHFLVCRSTEVGLERAVTEMNSAIGAP